MIKKIKEWLTNGKDILPNGCIPEGHKYSSYGMCLVCGEYK